MTADFLEIVRLIEEIGGRSYRRRLDDVGLDATCESDHSSRWERLGHVGRKTSGKGSVVIHKHQNAEERVAHYVILSCTVTARSTRGRWQYGYRTQGGKVSHSEG